MVFRRETFRNDKGIVVLQSVKVSHLSIIPNRFYESPKLKNWMCELCTFSQIRSHIAISHVLCLVHFNTLSQQQTKPEPNMLIILLIIPSSTSQNLSVILPYPPS